MLDRRLQILLDKDRHERLIAESRRRGKSVGALIRDAIDAGFPPRSPQRAAAGRRILAAPRMPAPGLDELHAELEQLRGGDR